MGDNIRRKNMNELVECPVCEKKLKRINIMHIKTHQMTVEEFDEKFPNCKRLEGRRRKENRDNKIKDGELNVDYVICPICQKPLREINTAHLSKHGMTVKDFDCSFPGEVRVPENIRIKKNHFSEGVSEEMSKKLKMSHTLEGYIKKYGEKEGIKRYQDRKKNMKQCKTLGGTIEKYGEKEGKIIFKKWQEKKKNTLDNFIRRHGKNDGMKKYKALIDKKSEMHRIVPVEKKSMYDKYVREVRKFSNISIDKYGLEGIEKRSRKFHLDHKFPIVFGFERGINPVVIGSIYNLEIIEGKENTRKGARKVNVSIEEIEKMVVKNKFYTDLIDTFYGD
jgi:hypothetical protein